MIKDIATYLDGGTGDSVRLRHAEAVAVMFDGFLTGLLIHEIPEMLIAGEGGIGVAQLGEKMRADAHERMEKHRNTLAAKFEKLRCLNELRVLEHFSSVIGPRLSAEARFADLYVTSMPYSGEVGEAEWQEQVLFNSGRACLFVPREAKTIWPAEHVLVGWRNTREAARAVAEALPFLRRAKSVTVAMVADGASLEADRSEPGADIARHLGRHGVNVELKHLTGWSRASEALLNEAERVGAGLIVIGGYGHSRFREWILGGATRDILRGSKLPVLAAH
ncbi:MAG: universal stress protein [Alphaproteobacteria bacterium]|nr:universal stress protein [Alphaproteobacteria bacterium]